MNGTVQRFGSGETALLLAAERLFAERGIEAVALRQINQAANQKNMSAAHYHFGSREGLVQAVLRYRLPQIDLRRRAMLERGDVAKDMRFYLESFIAPLVDELQPRPEGNHYIRFMQQYERYRGDYVFVRELTPASVRIYEALEGLVTDLPPAIARLRIGYMINMIHSVLASAEERMGRGEVAVADLPLIAANLVDMIANALTAPPSAGTLGILSAR
ncbi:MAG TPA: TetR family transcriptional regulator [Novosphingobium sp.]|nr:TetR family transcriptional regulator [Novosphingobium sp.]